MTEIKLTILDGYGSKIQRVRKSEPAISNETIRTTK